MKNKINRNGFTILELAIVIAVISILAAVSVPLISDVIQNAKDSRLLADARSAYIQYTADHMSDSAVYDIFLYESEGRVVAFENGSTAGVFSSKEDALKSLVDDPYTDEDESSGYTDYATPGHRFKNWRTDVPPTCVAAGNEIGSCSCGATDTRTIEPLGHSPSAEATCSTPKICTRDGCNYVYQAATGEHNYVDGICSVCGDELPVQATPELEFELNDDGESYRVVGLSDKTIANVIIPAIHNGMPVTAIGQQAFDKCTALRSITIPEGVLSIGNNAFGGCSNLVSVSFPDSLTSIENRAFTNCVALEEILIHDSVTTLGKYAFQGCTGLAQVSLGKGVSVISERAFNGCENLESVVFTDSVTEIGVRSFYDCARLKSVYFLGNEGDLEDLDITQLKMATVFIYSDERPAAEGSFWHYVDGVPTAW